MGHVDKVRDYEEAIEEFSYEMWLHADGSVSAGRELTTEEREASQDRVEAILSSLPDDERIILWAWMHGDRRTQDGDALGVRAAADGLGVPLTTFHRKLKKAIQHAREAAARYYSENDDSSAPEQYIEFLADVEVKPEPASPKVRDELVLSTYRDTKSIRKTAQACGVSKSTVQRIVDRAA